MGRGIDGHVAGIYGGEISLRRCPLSYRVSTARRNFCPPGHVQPRNRYAEEKISMFIAMRTDANLICRRCARRAVHTAGCRFFVFRHPVESRAAGEEHRSVLNSYERHHGRSMSVPRSKSMFSTRFLRSFLCLDAGRPVVS